MQCVFAASLGTLFAAIYFRTGNLWVTVFLHGAMDISSMLIGGLYGTTTVADAVSGYDASMLLSVLTRKVQMRAAGCSTPFSGRPSTSDPKAL